MGPQAHRLPFRIMWGITLLTAVCIALLNFSIILLIQWMVRLKFMSMQAALRNSGLFSGIFVLATISSCYAFIGVCLVMFLAPNCGGSGIPENKTYLNGGEMPGLFTRRTLVIRAVTNVLANAAGFPVGREGPMVTMGSNVAFLITKWLAKPYVTSEGCTLAVLVDNERLAHATRIACTVGGACAMAVIFNAPFGGLLYMFEEVTSISWPLEVTFRVFVATMCCSILSYGLCSLISSDIRDFVIYVQDPQDKKWDWADIPIFIILAALLGVLTSLHTRGLLIFTRIRQTMKVRLHRCQPYTTILETVGYAAACALASAFVSLLATCTEKGESGLEYVQFNCHEGEYNPIASLLVATSHSSVKLLFSGSNAGEIRSTSSILAFMTYGMLNVGLGGLPVPGGAFTATMLMGGLFGRSVGAVCRDIGLPSAVSGVYAVIGSAAMLCGFKQMTLASVLIVIECVNDLSLAPVVMLAVTVSMAVNWTMNERGHDEEVILLRKFPYLEGEAPHELDGLVALDLCDPLLESTVLPPEAHMRTVEVALRESQSNYFPIRDGDSGPCIGIVTRSHLAAMFESCGGTLDSNIEALPDIEMCSGPSAFSMIKSGVVDDQPPSLTALSLHAIMDPTPYKVEEDMPAPRLYALFAKAGERAACVTSGRGELRGIISREGLIAATRR